MHLQHKVLLIHRPLHVIRCRAHASTCDAAVIHEESAIQPYSVHLIRGCGQPHHACHIFMSATADSLLAGELAIEATSLHLLGQHDAALQTLQRLEGQLPEDLSVQHNLSVAGWYADAGTGIDALAQQLKACMEESRKQESSSCIASTVAPINYAILLYVQQQHAKALEILEPLFLGVESMHGGAALCLCVLLLEVYLGSNQHAKAGQMLHYLQSSLAPEVPLRTAVDEEEAEAEAANGNAGSQHGSPRPQNQQVAALQQSPKQLRSPQQHKLQQSPKPPREPLFAQQQRQQLQEEDSALPVSVDLCPVSRLTSSVMQQVAQVVSAHGGALLGVDVPALLHLYKARLAMACSNFKAAKKEVRGLLSLYPDSPAGVLLKCELEVLRQLPRKALKTLTPLLAAPESCTQRGKLQLLSLLAALHQQLGKHHVAALYLTTALEQQQQVCRIQQSGVRGSEENKQQQQQYGVQQCHQPQQQNMQAGKKQLLSHKQEHARDGLHAAVAAPTYQWLVPDENDALQYDLGLQQLLLGSWQPALECFEAASSSYYNRCTIWLRLAESGINLYHQQQKEQQQLGLPQGHQQQQRQLGSSSAIAVGSAATTSSGTEDRPGGSLTILQQAAQQLSTGLALLQEQQAEAAKEAEAAAEAMVAAAAAGQQLASVEQGLNTNTGSQWSTLDRRCSPVIPAGLVGFGSFSASTPTTASASSSSVAAAAMTAAAGLSGISSMVEACMIPQDLSAVQQALLANQAYVQLLLQHPIEALSAAQALLACSSSSPQYHYLGSCYAAEALLLLGRSGEAAEQLQGQLAAVVDNSSNSREACTGVPAGRCVGITGLSPSAGSSNGEHASSCTATGATACVGESGNGARLSSTVQMQAVLLANLSSVMAAQGNLEGSQQCAAAAAVVAESNITISPDVLVLRLQGSVRMPAAEACS